MPTSNHLIKISHLPVDEVKGGRDMVQGSCRKSFPGPNPGKKTTHCQGLVFVQKLAPFRTQPWLMAPPVFFEPCCQPTIGY